MGNYNPHLPHLLGTEWVPITDSRYALDTEVERGYTFALNSSTTVVSGAVYVGDVPPGASTRGILMAVYETGTEDLTGPMQRLVIPPVSGTFQLTDSGSTADVDPNGTSVANVLTHPNDFSYLTLTDDANLHIHFNANAYSAELNGKRILAITLLYTVAGDPPGTPGPTDIPTSNFVFLRRGPYTASPFSESLGVPEVNTSVSNVSQLSRAALGSDMAINVGFCDSGGALVGFYPWRYGNLQQFEPGNTAANQLVIRFTQTDGCGGCTTLGVPRMRYNFAGLEIIYCEEKRILYGGKGVTGCTPHLLVAGQNKVMLRPSDTFGATGKTLTAGEYTVTVRLADLSVGNDFGGNYETLALRQLYENPVHRGVELGTRVVEGGTFTKRSTNIIPQITLHTTSGVVTGIHAYGEQVAAPVYDGTTADQEIIQLAGGSAVSYPQVRFYARRFGDTNVPLRLLRVVTPTQFVSITPDEFDALPELIDGWREVTLRFATVPTFNDTGATSQWQWSATGLNVGNRWEILGMDADGAALPSPFNNDAATYGGDSAELNTDNSADAVIIFSQDPPAVTGLAVAVAEQSLEPIGQECSSNPECVPTDLYYHHVTWDAQDVLDTFADRTQSNGWGTSESGQVWSVNGGTADDYFVVTGSAFQHIDAVNTLYFSTIEARAFNVRVQGRFKLPVDPSGGAVTVRVAGRLEDTSNYYEMQASFATTGVVSAALTKRVGGTGSTISPVITLSSTHSAGGIWNIVLVTLGQQLYGKVWPDGAPEPDAWQAVAEALPGDALTGTQVAAISRAETGNLNTPFDVEWLEFSSTNLDVGAFELQRYDEVDAEWHTIMLSTGLAVNEFNDYEARVGVESQYRIRTVNTLDFNGSWSATVASTLTSPGVLGVGSDGNSVLIFTTNEVQSGASNLAYVMTWEGDVTEDFAFREADSVELRALYDRDFVTAFRPLERGGESFSRSILVQNAAVPSGRVQSGFRSLRDMAWADVSYVCVRNELGDRWLATVLVPNGRIQRNRRLYVARVDIIEVTDTPSVVDPAA